MPENRAVTVACVGAGYWGRNLVRNFRALGALAVVFDRDPVVRAAIAHEYPGTRIAKSWEEILRDDSVHAVVIATPADTHGRLAKAALEAGKDVFVEKPLCLSVEEGAALVDLAKAGSRVLMVGHLLLYHPAVIRLKALIDSGELGRIQYIYSHRLNLGKIRREENILWSFAPHDVSVILGLVQEMPEEVYARGGNYLHDRIADVTMSLLSFPSGIKAHLFVSWLHPFKEQKLVVVGDRKMAVFDDVEPTDKLVLYPHSIEWKNHRPVAHRAEAETMAWEDVEPLYAECEHFLDCIRNRSRPRSDGEEALRVLSVLRDCQVSLDAALPAGSAVSNGSAFPNARTDFYAHESAYLDENVSIGEGTTIWHFSHILRNSHLGKNCRVGQNVVVGPNVVVGDYVKIQNNVSVYEGVTLEDYVFCGPSMVFTNVYNPRSEIPRMNDLRLTLVRRGATLGANCTVLCGTTIGRYAFVGAGAVVLRDVPDFALVVGNPARIIGWMCVCGQRIRFNGNSGACDACNRQYEKSGGTITLRAGSAIEAAAG